MGNMAWQDTIWGTPIGEHYMENATSVQGKGIGTAEAKKVRVAWLLLLGWESAMAA